MKWFLILAYIGAHNQVEITVAQHYVSQSACIDNIKLMRPLLKPVIAECARIVDRTIVNPDGSIISKRDDE